MMPSYFLVGSTFSMVGGGTLAFTPKAPANIIRRSDLKGNFWATFVIGGDDGDSSVWKESEIIPDFVHLLINLFATMPRMIALIQTL